MPELEQSITDLCEKSTDLATRSDKLKELIRSTNEQLSEANVGIYTFVGDPISVYDDGTKDRLGWARTDRGWELGLVNTFTDADGDEVAANVPLKPLIDASQAVRIAAARYLPDLIARLTELVEKRLKQFEPIQAQIDAIDVIPF